MIGLLLWAKSSLGRIVIGAVLATLFLGWFYNWSAQKARESYELKLAIQTQKVQARYDELLDEAEKSADLLERRNEELEKELQSIVSASKARPGSDVVCIPDAVAERLRKLR